MRFQERAQDTPGDAPLRVLAVASAFVAPRTVAAAAALAGRAGRLTVVTYARPPLGALAATFHPEGLALWRDLERRVPALLREAVGLVPADCPVTVRHGERCPRRALACALAEQAVDVAVVDTPRWARWLRRRGVPLVHVRGGADAPPAGAARAAAPAPGPAPQARGALAFSARW